MEKPNHTGSFDNLDLYKTISAAFVANVRERTREERHTILNALIDKGEARTKSEEIADFFKVRGFFVDKADSAEYSISLFAPDSSEPEPNINPELVGIPGDPAPEKKGSQFSKLPLATPK